MDKRDIIVIQGTRIREMAYTLCQKADLKGMVRASCPEKDPLIVLKPNLIGPVPASEGATTHPEIAEAVITYLRGAGFQNVVMMESSWVGDKTSDALLVTGFGELSRRMNVPFVDLQTDQAKAVDCAGMTLNVCRRVLEADYLINLPVVKGHCQTRVTCALKNMKGCIPGAEKRRFHRMGLHEPIGRLSAGIRQDFILADAICPDLTFEDGGNPVKMDRLVCAADPVLMDAYACTMVGVDKSQVPYIRIAEQCGVGTGDLSGARILCLDDADRVKETLPDPGADIIESAGRDGDYRRILKIREMVEEIDGCSACYGTLIPVLHRMEEEGLLREIPGKLCIGQGWRGKKGHIGIGSCTAGFDHSLAGCPPAPEAMYRFLKEYFDVRGQKP